MNRFQLGPQDVGRWTLDLICGLVATPDCFQTCNTGAPSDYKVIENGEIEPGAAIFGAIVIDASKEVTVYVNGVETTVNIPAGGVTFYCFAVKEGGEFVVEINPAA
jgi:hypothetical protein